MRKIEKIFASILVAFVTVIVSATYVSAEVPLVQITPLNDDSASGVKIISQLDLGMKSDEVKILQTFLAGMPDIYPGGFVTGYFGALTQDAVKMFQQKYGLPVAGRVGPKTLAKINELLSNNNTLKISAISTENISKNAVRVRWQTDIPATTELTYSISPDFPKGDMTQVMRNKNTEKIHVVDLYHLNPGTKYYLVLTSVNSSKATTTSQTSLTTLTQ